MTTTDRAQDERLLAKYGRIEDQLRELYVKVRDPQSRMASAAALLHAKMPHFFWTGFYRLVEGDLLVGPYQGPLACMLLERGKGVCWATVNQWWRALTPGLGVRKLTRRTSSVAGSRWRAKKSNMGAQATQSAPGASELSHQ